MAVTEKDIYASAKIFVEEHGDSALMEAMKNIAKFDAEGDMEAKKCWNQIAKAIEWIQMPADLKDDTCH